MSVLPEDAHVKTYARLLLDRIANPEDYPDMNDDSIKWQEVFDSMRRAYDEENNHMSSVLSAGLIALSGYDPWGGAGPGQK